MLQELCCLHDYCMIFSILSFFFCFLNIPFIAILKMSTMLSVPTRDTTPSVTATDSNICPGADLGTKVYTNYYWLLMLRTPLTRTGMLPNMPSLSPSISTNVVFDLCSQIFKTSNYRKISMSLFCLSLSHPLPLSVFLVFFFKTFFCLF